MSYRPAAVKPVYSIGLVALMIVVTMAGARMAVAATLTWDEMNGATGYRVYYSLDNTITPSDPHVDVGPDVFEYELCSLPLDPCVSYYIQAFAFNNSGEAPIGSPQFYANNNPRVTTFPSAVNVAYNRAAIQWTTNVPATSVVDYGTSPAYGSTETSVILTTSHYLVLTGLAPDTTYHFKVSSFAADTCGPGCDDVTGNPLTNQMFLTPWAPDNTPPAITSGPEATDITTTSATIVWTTDEDSTSRVEFDSDTSGEPYTDSIEDSNLLKSHNLALSGLTPETVYYYRVTSTDGAGNGPTQSTEGTFTTLNETPPPPMNVRIVE